MFNYFYTIKCKSLNMYYIGSRCSTVDPKLDLLQTYTTSSKTVNVLLCQNGIDDFEIIKIKSFDSYIDAVEYEDKILRSIKNKTIFLNINFTAGGQIIKSKTHTFITNDGITFMQYPKNIELPRGYWVEWYNKPPTRLGLRKITNGIESKFIASDNVIPENWMYISEWNLLNPKPDKRPKRDRKLLFWVTDGTQNKKVINDTEIPEGWYRGKTEHITKDLRKKREIGSTRSRICITDGFKNRFIKRDQCIPENWYKGITRCSNNV